ncbi:Crp/Fnr family transcriptional regulator [Occallatibacter riparius]|uniref:Cyclic nucleotide-binding domain-containing protein n=1 Tax=Occallatibacter riparius TaxID=1002689 RepID=A0A9J7BL84_9BACT|nr:cyclic nucleotide-binding domain-containing protein [Occallatibacter riparius]UWZ82530.1 cyclic nucleotide-binding domain-containing protein [Occallatibacter riparius]
MALVNFDASAFVGDEELIRVLKGRSIPVDCSEDRALFYQGDDPVGVYIVHGGTVTIAMRTRDGDAVMDMKAEPGSLLGLPAVVSNSRYSLSAKAKQGADVSFVGRDEFSKMMLTEPGVAVLILKVLAAEVRTARIAACKG